MEIPTAINIQLNHKTIRKFKDTPLTVETINLLLEVANRSASSNGMQHYSMIIVDDLQKKDAISKVCNQEHMKQSPFFIMFIVDTYRNNAIIKERGVETDAFKDIDRYFQGLTDAIIAAQNMVNAAEYLGLGTVYFGSILNDVDKIIEILELPELTMPAIGLGIGYPDQEPMLKPRIPLKHKVFYNTYKKEENYEEAFVEYDRALNEYYDLRDLSKPIGKFSDQLIAKYKGVNQRKTSLVKTIQKQGYVFSLDEK